MLCLRKVTDERIVYHMLLKKLFIPKCSTTFYLFTLLLNPLSSPCQFLLLSVLPPFGFVLFTHLSVPLHPAICARCLNSDRLLFSLKKSLLFSFDPSPMSFFRGLFFSLFSYPFVFYLSVFASQILSILSPPN